MLEEWRKIPELPERFEVSNLGRVRSVAYIDTRGHRRRAVVYKGKGARVGLYIDGKQKDYAIAALVLLSWSGPPPGRYGRGGIVSRHLNDDRTNSSISNLAWGSMKENSDDAMKNGKWLTEPQVAARNAAHARGGWKKRKRRVVTEV